jgi:hypothetical protein
MQFKENLRAEQLEENYGNIKSIWTSHTHVLYEYLEHAAGTRTVPN